MTLNFYFPRTPDPYSIMGTVCIWYILLTVLYPTFFSDLNLEKIAPRAPPAVPASIEDVISKSKCSLKTVPKYLY